MKPFASLRGRSTSGFTLIEVMLCVFTISLMALTLACVLPMARKTAIVNGQYAQASSLCQHKVDQLRAMGFGRMNYTELHDAKVVDDTPTSSPFSFKNIDHVDDDTVATYFPNSTATVTLQPVTGQPDKILATVTISWRPVRNQTHTCTMTVTARIINQG
jgi:Tfp pilus assembly protein PilV